MFKRRFILIMALLIVGLTVIFPQDYDRIGRELEQLSKDFQAGKITAQQYQQRAAALQQEMLAGPSITASQLQRIEALLEQDKRLEAQFNEGNITEEAYKQQSTATRNEINQIFTPFRNSASAQLQYKEIEDRVNTRWLGSIIGWPSNTVFLDRTWPVLRQPAGTGASYSIQQFVGEDARPVLDSFTLYLNNATEADYQNLKRQIENGIGSTFNEQNGHTMYVFFQINENGTYQYYYHNIGINNGIIRYHRNSTAYDDGPDTQRRD